MARITDQEIINALQPHLQPGEQLRNWALAYQQPTWLLILGALAAVLFTKFYMMGLTDRRLLIVQYKGRLKVQQITEHRIGQFSVLKTKTGPLNTLLTLQTSSGNFFCKFHRNVKKDNRPHALALIDGIQQAGGYQPAAYQTSVPRQAPPVAQVIPPQQPPPQYTPPPPPQARTNGMSLRLGARRLALVPEVNFREEDIAGLLSQARNGVVAAVDRNPNDPSVLGLKNLSTNSWKATLPGGEQREVASGRTIKLVNGTRINFGFCDGVID